MDRLITLSQLRQLCQKYDKEYGHWPESDYEGWALYDYIIQELDFPRENDWNDVDNDR